MVKRILFLISFALFLFLFLSLPLVKAEDQAVSNANIQNKGDDADRLFFNEVSDIKIKMEWDNEETKNDAVGLLYLIPPQVKPKAILRIKNELKKNGYLGNDDSGKTTGKKITKQDFIQVIKSIAPFHNHQGIDKYFQSVENSKKPVFKE